ncbi:hypothetical protein PDESU_05667 [Pontiella desulfatans]|uniref:Uncharacterized protein n=2 Tax=Pontiella desulfatans TaxID=2750659 RepID=A0A6C2UAD2_PONDE|nr:hypothetical protein PDESU_05667 [Pontiella desulfatans]
MASSFAVGGISTNGEYSNVSSWQQPVDPTQSTGGDYVNQSGFLAGFIEQDGSDIDGDGLVDTLDPDNDNDGILDLAEISGSTFNPPVPTDPNKDDSDGDGSSDMAEFLFGYDPTNPDSRFQISPDVGASNGAYQLTFQTLKDRMYVPLYCDDLATANWVAFTNVGNSVWIESRGGTNSHTVVDDFTVNTSGTTPTNSVRFYRVSVQKIY